VNEEKFSVISACHVISDSSLFGRLAPHALRAPTNLGMKRSKKPNQKFSVPAARTAVLFDFIRTTALFEFIRVMQSRSRDTATDLK